MDIGVDERTCLNIKESLKLEWLDANGEGGYASSTILNCHTRRYHGLLVCSLMIPPGRYVLLSKFEESILVKDKEFFLSFHKYPGIFSPLGYKYLKHFQANPCPHFIYQIGNMVIQKTIMTVYGENCVLVRYLCDRSDTPVLLRLKPFLAFRDFHSLSRENLSLQVRTYKVENGFKIQPYDGMPPLFLQTSRRSAFYASPVWYRNFEYVAEAERGFDFREDLFQPGIIEIELKEGESIIVSASTAEFNGVLRKKWDNEEARRRGECIETESVTRQFNNPEDADLVESLIEAGKSFLIRTSVNEKKKKKTIIAGYHWFGSWGRDTLISLPGLTFCSGRLQEGIDVLSSIAYYEKDGLLPNFCSENGSEHAYNAVDCSLWYFWAIQQLYMYKEEMPAACHAMWRSIWPVMTRILQKYMEGTAYGIHMGPDGLLQAGTRDTQLTWMDAKVNGVPVTPRHGSPVEVNALWFNAVCFMDEIAGKFGKDQFRFPDLIAKIRRSFNDVFWIEEGEGGYLGDVFREGLLDHSVRPNQIFAVSLPYSPLELSKSRSVVEKVGRELLTPFGLRTLSPGDKAYKGRYAGDSATRDAAYHQGTVWPWLLGHFGEAYFKTAEDKPAAKEFLLNHLRTFMREHLNTAGLGTISEIFDGDPPHEPNGCISQAWSVAEVIRLYCLLNRNFCYPEPG